MTIAVGDRIPSVKLKRIGADGVEDFDTASVFAPGRRVVLFGLPGPFTPTCSKEHLPGYVARAGEIKAKGVDEIVCMSVADHWVMKAWSDAQGDASKVSMLPDGSALFTRALGLENDLGAAGLGLRCKRFSMLVEDGVVKTLAIEPGKGAEVSGANACLAQL